MMPPSSQQSMYPQPQYPQDQYVPPPMPVGPRHFFNKGIIMVLVLMGLVMFFVGLMILSSTVLIKPPNSGDTSSYSDTIRNMGGAGRLVIEIGGLLACIGLVCGGIVAEDVTDKIRAVMVSAGVAFVISTLVVLGLFGSLGTL
jgi:hypothetical protein